MVRPAAAILLAVLLAPPAWGTDLTLSLGGEVQYDDNAFRRQLETDDNLFFRLRPGARIHQDRGDLTYTLAYEAPAEFTIEDSEELRNVDHVANGRFGYRVTDRLQLTGSDHFVYRRGQPVERLEIAVAEDSEALIPIVTEERQRFRSNQASLGLSYAFSPRWVGNLRAQHHFFDSSFENRSEVQTASGTADTLYVLSRQHRLGAGLRYTRQEVEERVGFPGSHSDIYNIFGQWQYTFDARTEFHFSAGPSLIETELEGLLGGRRTRWTVFANALLSRQWTDTLDSALRYRRSQDETTGTGGTVIVDALSFSTSWAFLERWSASLRGDWTRRESEFPTGILFGAGTERFEARRWSASGQLRHRLFRNTHVYLRVTYDEQESRRRLSGATSDFENFLATLGIRHEFDRIKLW